MGGCEHKWITCMWSAKGSHSPHLERIRNIRLCCDLTVQSCKSRKKKTSVDHSLNQDMSLQWTWQGRYLHYRLVVFIRHHDRDAFEFLLLLNVYLQGNIKINHLKINHSKRKKKKKKVKKESETKGKWEKTHLLSNGLGFTLMHTSLLLNTSFRACLWFAFLPYYCSHSPLSLLTWTKER